MSAKNIFSSGSSTPMVDLSMLLLRVVAGVCMLYAHGLGKFQKLVSGADIEFVSFLGLGAGITFVLVVLSEFICAALVTLGLFTRIASIPLIITMTYIVFVYHAKDAFKTQELPLLYLIIFAVILMIGPGKYSLDRMISKRNKTI